jgi:hypothetical protein
VYKQVIDFLNSNNILTEEQFGFRKGLSTDKALYRFLDEILCALNDKMHVVGIFCDLAKAFDCVNHDIIIKIKFLWSFMLDNDLHHILIADNKELKLNILIQILIHIPTGAL